MRFDRLPMDRSAQSAGSGEALFERREVDPSYPLTQKRRPGSLRQDDYCNALGIRADADASYWYWPEPLDVTTAGAVVAFSVKTFALAEDGSEELLFRIQQNELGDPDVDNSLSILWERVSVSSYRFLLRRVNPTGTAATVTLGTLTPGNFNLALTMEAANGDSILYVEGEGTTSFTLDNLGAENWLSFLGDPQGVAKTTGARSVISNIAVYDNWSADPSGLYGDRTPAVLNLVKHFNLDGDDGLIEETEAGSGFIYPHPAAPQVVNSAARFGGRSGAIAIEGSLDTERFFSTAAEAVADKEFTIHIKGTRGNRGATGREEILFDYGDLAQVRIDTDNTVDFIYNGVTVASAQTIASDAAFEIYAGRNGSTLFISVGGTETQDTSSDPAPPFLDYSDAPTIYIGAEADVTQDTRYVGSLTKVAMWPERTLTDLGARTAAFYLDLTDAIEDKSPNGGAVTEEIHSSDSGDPHFVAGPLDDAAHRACEGGVVLGDSGPVASGWDVALDKRIEGDVTGIRFGRRVIVTSQDSAHVLDSEAKVGRPFGIPQPPPGVSTTALGSGPLDGVYGYGYRFLSRDGTYGPVRRLDPVKATSGARVVIGSTGGTGESELGETYGNIPASTTSSFSKQFAADPGAGNYVAEVYGRLLNHDPEDVEEDVMERGMVSSNGNAITYLQSGSPSALDLSDDFTIQCDFRYRRRNGLTGDGIVSTIICGLGSSNTDENADLFAAIIGDDGGDTSQTKYDTDFPNNPNNAGHYGDSGARLVIGIPRRKIRADIEFGSGRNFPSENYFLQTFSDDSWTDGRDYTLIVARQGKDLRVYVRDRTVGGVFTELTGNTMGVSGVATSPSSTGAADGYGSSRYSGTLTASGNYTSGSGGNFFRDWSPRLSSRRMYFGNAGWRIVIPFISNDAVNNTRGVPEHCDHRNPEDPGVVGEKDIDQYDCSLKPFDDDTELYHLRAWSSFVGISALASDAGKRFAARDDGELTGSIVHDVACVVEDVSGYTRKVQDVASGAIFSIYEAPGQLTEATYFAQDTAALKPDRQHFYVLEDNSGGPGKAIELYWTSEGNGSWRLGVNGEEYYNILGRTAEPYNGNASQRIVSRDTAGINDILAPDDEYNWFSFEQRKISSGDSLVQVLNWAVNGSPLFTINLGGVTTQMEATTGPSVHVGGWDGVTGDKQVAIGEFRFWGDDLGPDPETGDDFDYLGGRVSENEFANLLAYWKFQPVDELGGALLQDYGSDAGLVGIGGTASIVDPRGTAGLIGFPSAPAEYVTGVELLRSIGISVQDPEDESEVQEALDEARGAPLFRLAVIPTGSSHYVDSSSDGALGFEVDTRTGYVPQVIKGAFIWQGQIGLAGDKTTLHFAEPGPFGWESYPRWLDYEVPGAGGDLTAATSAGNVAYAFGKTWAVALTGSPSNPEPVGLGGGVGATDQRSVAAWGDKLFTHNGQLWHIQGAQAVDIGGPVRDLLPDAGSCRLVVSALLSSLLVINTTSGLVLRFYFPTGQWSIEDRYILAAGDLADGSATALISVSGTYAQSSASYVADDVEASTDTSGSGTLSGDTVTLGANITIPTLCRVQVEDANGVTAAAVATESGSTGTLTFPANSMDALAAGAVTVRPGVPAEGMVIDTGWINHGYAGHLRNVLYTVDSGSDWEIGSDSGATAGGRASRSGVSYAGVAGTGERLGIGHGGRYVRLVARNLGAEFGEIGCLETDMRPGGVAQ